MKRTLLVIVLALAVLAGTAAAGTREFWKGGIYVTPQIGINRWTIPFGVNVEYGLTENIGLAGTGMIWLWSDEWASSTAINLGAEANYHFTKLQAEKFDLYAGGGLGYTIYSFKEKSGWLDDSETGSSGIYIQTVLGGRYYFNPKMAVSLRLVGSLVGHWAGIGATIGVTFVMGK